MYFTEIAYCLHLIGIICSLKYLKLSNVNEIPAAAIG